MGQYQIDRKRLIGSVTRQSIILLTGCMHRDVLDMIDENDSGFGVTPTGTDYSYNSAGQSGSIGLTNQLNI